MTRYAEQPGADGGAAVVGGQRTVRPDVGLLGEVIGGVGVDEGGAEAADVGLGRAHEGGEGDPVTGCRAGGEPLEIVRVHAEDGSQAGSRGNSPGSAGD